MTILNFKCKESALMGEDVMNLKYVVIESVSF